MSVRTRMYIGFNDIIHAHTREGILHTHTENKPRIYPFWTMIYRPETCRATAAVSSSWRDVVRGRATISFSSHVLGSSSSLPHKSTRPRVYARVTRVAYTYIPTPQCHKGSCTTRATITVSVCIHVFLPASGKKNDTHKSGERKALLLHRETK